jgi:hypothetical protein
MPSYRELQQGILLGVLFVGFSMVATGYAHGSSSEGQQIGKVLSVKKVLGRHYFVSRYPQIHYYLLYFAVRTSDHTYCAEYETPVLDEIDDLFDAKDKDVEIVLKGKNLTLRKPEGRKLKARLVEEKRCAA